jgi:hypothetical protein
MALSTEPSGGSSSAAPRRAYPAGMIVVLCWFAYSALLALYKCFDPGAVVLANHLTGGSATAFHAVSLVVPLLVFWGIIRKQLWGRTLGIVWQAFGALLAAVNYCWFFFYPAEMLAAYKSYDPTHAAEMTMTFVHGSVLIGLLFSAVVAALVIWYLVKRREYFA